MDCSMPSPTPGAYSNLCPSSRWCHPVISSSVEPFSSHLQSFPASGSFSSESVLCIRWPKNWSFSFSISPSNGYSGLISFRMGWLDLLAVQETLNSLLLEKCYCISPLFTVFFFFQFIQPTEYWALNCGSDLVLGTTCSLVLVRWVVLVKVQCHRDSNVG